MKKIRNLFAKDTRNALFRFTNTGDSITITGYTGKKRRIVIPSEIDGLPVTAIDHWAFRGIPIKKLTLPETLTWIGGEAFLGNHLKTLVIPDSVKTIKSEAFISNVRKQNVSYWDQADFIRYFMWDSRLLKITLGSDVSLTEDSFGYGNFFLNEYTANGKTGGTYTRPNCKSKCTEWTKKKE